MSCDGYGLTAAGLPSTALPDWQPDLERLKRETQQAKESGRSDPWTLAEAESWLDLVDAEIAAQAHLQTADEGVALRVLRTWKAELGALVRSLHALERSAQASFPHTADQDLAA
jgi:hypothetical protein